MSIFSKSKLGTADNQIVFNDYTIDPVYRIIARSPSKWQIEQQDLPVPFESGSNDFLTLIGESAYIIVGKMYPSAETSYDDGLNALRSVASLDIEQADPASDTGYVPFTWGDALGDYSKQIFVKPMYCQLAETTQQGFVQPFVIYCKVKDPTIFSGSSKSATSQSSSVTTSGGDAAFPAGFPMLVGSTLMAVSATATNLGTLDGYPASIQIYGPINHPKITNGASGEFIEVDCNLTSATDLLTITYDKDSLDINLNGISQIQNLTSNSTLFKLKPGLNVLSLTGASVSDNAYFICNYYDTWPLA